MPSKSWSSIRLPDELRSIPAMLSDEEKQYLVWLTATAFEGWGAIVDLGCWLGSSSAALAEGLKRGSSLRPHREPRFVHMGNELYGTQLLGEPSAGR